MKKFERIGIAETRGVMRGESQLGDRLQALSLDMMRERAHHVTSFVIE